jgi:hypothetical protein
MKMPTNKQKSKRCPNMQTMKRELLPSNKNPEEKART